MVDELIDVIEPIHPGPMGDITPEARKALAEMRDLHGSTTALQDQAIAGRIDDASSETRAALERLRRRYCVFIGDSWTQLNSKFTTRQWSTMVCDRLGYDEVNYAAGGTGYVRPIDGVTFLTQAQRAASQTERPHSECAYVFLMGGNNDVGTKADFEQYRTNIRRVIDTLQKAYPQARIVMTGLNAPIGHYWGCYMAKYAYELSRASLSFPDVIFIDNPAREFFNPDVFGSYLVQYHPNTQGAQLLANVILDALDGVNKSHMHAFQTRVRGFFVSHYDDSLTNKQREIWCNLSCSDTGQVIMSADISQLQSKPDEPWDIAMNSGNVYWDTQTLTPPLWQNYVVKGVETPINFMNATAIDATGKIVNIRFEYSGMLDDRATFKLMGTGLTAESDGSYRIRNIHIEYPMPYPYGAFNSGTFEDLS